MNEINKDEIISQKIIERCDLGILLLGIIDVVLVLLFLITLTIGIGAIITVLILIIVSTFFIFLCKKMKKNPLKYRKYFFNLEIDDYFIYENIKDAEMKRRQELANEVNRNYEFTIENIVFSENDKLRIEKNCKIMKEKSLPFFEQMKLIPLDSNTKIKTSQEIALQMIWSFIIARKAYNKLNNIPDIQDQDLIYITTKYPNKEVYNLLSKISKGEINNVLINELVYLYEQVNVFAWILGLKDKPSTTNLCEINKINNLIIDFSKKEDNINNCRMISNEQILEYADLITRYEWAMIELNKKGVFSKNINKDVVIEQKKAMDFVVSYNPLLNIKQK